ncbi:glycolate oxidase [Rubritalea squalenifaciens DSM 18772]|uniref:Glycolate oxidase n=1 Tax=Rubritalea squalenifaciens DSM 18772 TaxID=1123071 RepID=A0A1M6BLQ6_9BACT|nr:FAD-linked oxidase C-terminal domain-containing protein [Rubritalea squalenifaciens]SHI49642.1 glycolate oxidase [Rubritalea squalenifaciens DSM 18772]
MSTLYQDLSALLPDGQVSVAEQDLEVHSIDKWHASAPPQVVVFARSTEDVEKVMKYANEHEVPVYTRGAGVGYVGGCVPVQGGIALSVAKMDEILEINTGDGVAVVQPGVITGHVQAAAREKGWYYPPDPASLKECSIGGNIATNAGGPRCLKYGVTKQYILGVTVVTATGEVLKLGGRCHKNKTGFDLTTLMCGSEGMLGVVTEAILRIIPHPETRGMLGASFVDFSAAAAAVQAILDSGVLPSALEITDAFTLAAARDYLGEDALPPGDAYLMVEIDGKVDSVQKELASLQAFLKELGALRINEAPDEAACEEIWQLRRDFSYSLKHTGLTKLNEDVVVPRSKLVDLVNYARKLQEDTGIDVACFGHAGDGNIHTNLMVKDYSDPETKEKADNALDLLFNWVLDHGGAITGEHGVGLAKKRWIGKALGGPVMDAHCAIKAALDPKGILNPGKFLD